MQTLVWEGDSELRLGEAADPEGDEAAVVAEVRLAGVCGSDLHALRGSPGPRTPPLVLGHEAVARVPGRPGRFAVFPLAVDGTCPACRRGEENLCAHRGLLGLDRPGVFAGHVRVPADALFEVPEAMEDRCAVLVEPAAAGVSALRTAGAGGGSRVLVIGAGSIGLLAAYAARRLGADVRVIEPVGTRRELAARLTGAEVAERLEDAPAGEADVVLDAVGSAATLPGAVRAARAGGEVSLIGLGAAEAPLPLADVVRRGILVRGQYAYTRADFQATLDLLAEHPPPLDWLTVVPLEDGPGEVARLLRDPGAVAKLVLDPTARSAR